MAYLKKSWGAWYWQGEWFDLFPSGLEQTLHEDDAIHIANAALGYDRFRETDADRKAAFRWVIDNGGIRHRDLFFNCRALTRENLAAIQQRLAEMLPTEPNLQRLPVEIRAGGHLYRTYAEDVLAAGSAHDLEMASNSSRTNMKRYPIIGKGKDLGSADMVVEVPGEDLVITAPMRTNARRKAPEDDFAPSKSYEMLLVRTGLVRAKGYDFTKLKTITGPASVALLCKHLIHATQEYMLTVCLDRGNRVIAIHETALGTASGASFEAADVVRVLLLTGALGFIHVHNHPSGNPYPSSEDRSAWRRVEESASCVGLQFMDGLILGFEGYYSKLESGSTLWSDVSE